MNPEEPSPLDAHEIYFKLVNSIENSVKATKAGLAAFKKGSPDGAFYNAYDNINEGFKLLEDAIAATGVNTAERKVLKIGVNVSAQDWFVEEAGKYEWDGPKS